MLNDLFIIYANLPLSEDASSLKLIFDEIVPYTNQHNFDEQLSKNQLTWLISCIKFFSELNDLEESLVMRDTIYNNEPFRKELTDLAFEAVYYYRNEKCEDCIKGDFGSPEKFLKFGLLEKQLKCFECYQIYFRGYLSDIAEGKNYLDMMPHQPIDEEMYKDMGNPPDIKIGDMQRVEMDASQSFEGLYLKKTYDCIQMESKITDDGNLVKSVFISFQNLFHFHMDNFRKELYPENIRFNYFLNSVVSYSLVEFLLNNDRRKIKLCPYCNNFFIAKNISRQRCYEEDCEKAFQREKKRKQRENDPVKYYSK